MWICSIFKNVGTCFKTFSSTTDYLGLHPMAYQFFNLGVRLTGIIGGWGEVWLAVLGLAGTGEATLGSGHCWAGPRGRSRILAAPVRQQFAHRGPLLHLGMRVVPDAWRLQLQGRSGEGSWALGVKGLTAEEPGFLWAGDGEPPKAENCLSPQLGWKWEAGPAQEMGCLPLWFLLPRLSPAVEALFTRRPQFMHTCALSPGKVRHALPLQLFCPSAANCRTAGTPLPPTLPSPHGGVPSQLSQGWVFSGGHRKVGGWSAPMAVAFLLGQHPFFLTLWAWKPHRATSRSLAREEMLWECDWLRVFLWNVSWATRSTPMAQALYLFIIPRQH